jgi:UDP-glucuronate 4-epimerase
MKILVTGNAGFIGFHLCKTLLSINNFKNNTIVGLDNLNNYYDIKLKKDRLKFLKKISKNKKYFFYKIDLCNYKNLKKIFRKYKFDTVIHLAAQAGVRASIKKPSIYTNSNLVGTFNLIDIAKEFKIKHFLFASTSSVYGNNNNPDFAEKDNTDFPIQYYAATKKSNEVMLHCYSKIYSIPVTCMRFFTVYGPWGRPDMSLNKFISGIIKNKFLPIHNNGKHFRSFTYIDDVIKCIVKLINKPPTIERKKTIAPFQTLNVGTNVSSSLNDYLVEIEKNLGKKAKKIFLPLQLGDVISTKANNDLLYKKIKYIPKTTIQEGIKKTIEWYINYFK